MWVLRERNVWEKEDYSKYMKTEKFKLCNFLTFIFLKVIHSTVLDNLATPNIQATSCNKHSQQPSMNVPISA